MPPSTFASAAAGTNSSQNLMRDAANDWLRRTNGATQTFRRASGATTTTPTTAPSQHPHDDSGFQQPRRYIPPHRNGTLPDTRYSKDQLLDVFRTQQSADASMHDGLPGLFVGGWQPDMANGASTSWGRSDIARDTQPGPDVCWNQDDLSAPLGLVDMDDAERETFTTSVNSPIKLATSKDGQQTNGLPGRKISISGSANAPGGSGLPSPSVARGGARRRETSESYPFPANSVSSPGAYARDDGRAPSPPPSLLRRRTDIKDLNRSEDSNGDEKGASTPFGTLKRHPTGPLSAGFNAPVMPWAAAGPQSAGLSPMGSFGNFGMGSGQQGTPSEKRPGLSSARSESRFKNVLSKDGGEEGPSKTIESKASISSLSRVNENESWRVQDRAELANEPLDEAEEDLPTGSAALADDADLSPPHPRQGYRGFGTPSRQGTQDDFGFGAFGMTSDNAHGFGQGSLLGRDSYHQTPAHSRMGVHPGNEPMSPTDTNPYQSPEQHGVDRMAEEVDNEGNEPHNNHLPGLGQFGADPSQQLGGLGGLGALPNLGRAHGQGPASDRSQTSSAGPNRGFSGLSGLGGLGAIGGSAGWPASQGGIGTPGRQGSGLSSAFPGGMFSNQMPDMQSPALAGLRSSNLMTPSGGAFGGSRMASMFPPQMQDQMRQSEREGERSAQPFGGLGDFGRATESPFADRGFNDTQLQEDAQRLQLHQQGGSQEQALAQGQPPATSASNQPPAPQQRTMVMPDRMRWIYKDPQGQTQGPWSGLEMHDWYKAGFFSPELLVKKFEDPDYEPLAQLIRRIGNSREPFLVPQIGIPHGPAGTNPGPAPWTGSIGSSGSAQPPFASSFPSFGTTLTAEQQNALERRKQEEQYLMARQKEHLAQAQMTQRMQLPPHQGMMQGQLHHHSSAHSLQSQPSFGSITSPTGYQPSPVSGSATAASGPHAQGFFDSSFRAPQGGHGAVGAPSLGHIREEELPGVMDRMNLGERQQQGQFGAPGQPFASQQSSQQANQQESHEGKVQQMMQDRARLQQEQAEHDARDHANEPQKGQSTEERLQHFHRLQAQGQQEAQAQEQPPAAPQQIQQPHDSSVPEQSLDSSNARAPESQPTEEPLSLTEQVQKAASAKQSPAPQQPGLPQPFPPAPSQSPLPAPAAQRAGRQSVADQLQTETRDGSQTPSVDTPSATIAPWAREPAEAPRGPSLKEIQEYEQKKTAQADAQAAAARRAQFEKELEAQAQASAPPPPGIPASATWGAPSPATPTGSAPAAWAKTAQKPSGPTSSKTLAQIQKEEEARKRRAANAALQQAQLNAMANVAAPAGGKSYANLAGKITASPVQGNVVGGAWTTVGSSGKMKTPAPPPTAARALSASIVPTVQPPVPRKAPARSTTTTTGAVNAIDEFKKWAVQELRPELKKHLNAENFVSEMLQYPLDVEIMVDAVHASSDTIDSRHFAEEWIRRKKLADKGFVDNNSLKSASPANAAAGSGGWSEVAKKGPSKEQPKEEAANGNFRVVPSKKRGGAKR